VTTFLPYLIAALVMLAAGFVAWRFWDTAITLIAPFAAPYRTLLERAAVRTTEGEIAFRMLAVSIVLWGLYILFYRPAAWIGIVTMPVSFALTFWAFGLWIKSRISKRLQLFNNQLEIALRLMTSGLRAGLGLRQALVVVVSEMPDPIRIEFNRVLSQTSIGVSVYDALDMLNQRMPSQEMLMMTKAIRIQSKTGGNLGRVLETLAETIKQRRRIDRKVATLTSEARASSYVMTGLPIFIGIFIIGFQPAMRDSLLGTFLGRVMLAGSMGLLVLGQLVMNAMSKVDV
jgi:Flp pilus assembly protein TadB